MLAPKSILSLRPEDIEPYNPLPDFWTAEDIPLLYRPPQPMPCNCYLCRSDEVSEDMALVVTMLGIGVMAACGLALGGAIILAMHWLWF